jgi:hypothetical protein
LSAGNRKIHEKVVEFNSLSPDRKWHYLEEYWSKASKFYDLKQELVVPDDQVHLQIEKLKAKPSPKFRRVIALKDWRWKLDPGMTGIKESYFKHNYPDESWKSITLPHNVNYTPDPLEFGKVDAAWYNFPTPDKPTTIYLGEYALWYRTSIPLRKNELDGKRAFLRFESCSIETTAWVDEWPVILKHYGVYPFETEVTEEFVKSRNDEKVIALKVVSRPSNTPAIFYNELQYAYHEKSEGGIDGQPSNWGGINGTVELVLTSHTYIKDIFIYTKTIEPGEATLHVSLEIENTSEDMFEGSVLLDVKRWYPEESGSEETFRFEVHARPLATTIVEKDIRLHNPVLWGSWNPNLYVLHATLSQSDGEPCDDLYETFGVRKFTADGDRFLLNGQPIMISAIHDMCMYLNTPPTSPQDYWIVQDILIHKALGMVAARYPSDNRVHYRRIAEYADQMGLMLIWEGYCGMWSQPPDIETLARRDIPLMIRDLRNHPSIIVWTLGDETYYYDPVDTIYHNKRFHFVELAYEVARGNDPSRLIVPVGHWVEDLVQMIEKLIGRGMSVEEARKKSLELLPVFRSVNVYWAIHSLPSGADTKPVYAVMDRYRKALCGLGCPVTFDEFACEGMPNWDLCRGEWWYKRWTVNPMAPSGKKHLEPTLIGRLLTPDDWHVSQAYQASVHWRVLSYIRESGAFAGFSNCHVRDVLNYFAGLVDARGRGKLAYFLYKNMLSRFFISAMHGNYLFNRKDQLSITISNNGPILKRGKLKLKIANATDTITKERTIEELTVNHVSTSAVNYELDGLPPDLYSIEYYLYDETGREAGRSLDMFYVES